MSDIQRFWCHEASNIFCVRASDFDRVTAERDALQQRLNAADQRLDELISAVRSINHAKHHEVHVPGDDQPQYGQRKEWVEWILGLCGESPENPTASPATINQQGGGCTHEFIPFVKHCTKCGLEYKP
ncbi:hypothetical protein [Pseudomonas sp. R16(2017)]|uniref:hypothetical protein n=1 Tax=Pseudomonas sp. R16(2017) TaxID=1981704 RepID=UPI000A1DECF3|nr:hypothetical protein [Pseudomonas sp. R16(2017)]